MDPSVLISIRPSVFKSFGHGLKVVGAKPWLIISPVVLDLVLLFSPHLTIEKYLLPLISLIKLPPNFGAEMQAAVTESVKTLSEAASYYSISSWLRSIPFGIPSLISTRIMQKTPLGAVNQTSITSFLLILAMFLVFTAVGVLSATFYYSQLGNEVFPEKEKSVNDFMRRFGNLLILPFLFLLAVFLFSIPATLLLSLGTIINPFIGYLVYFGILIVAINVLFPLFFTPHAVIVEKMDLFNAAKESIRLFKGSGIFASFFVVGSIFITFALNRLWQAAPDSSWAIFVGIFGHAVVSSALGVASFYFYKDAQRFVNELNRLGINPAGKLPPQV